MPLQPIIFLSLVFILTLANSAASQNCEQAAKRFTPPVDAKIVIPMSGVEINDVQFCQISYQLDRSITTVAEDFEALFLEWHGSDPAIDHSAYRITLFGTQAEMNDYVEIIDLDSAALVNLSLMTPITAETAFSTPTQLFAGLPVQSHTHLGGMSLYHLDMPFGRIAAETQLHSYLKQSGWKREQMSVSEQRYIRGDATAVLETADQSDSITLIIIQP